jgi:hypothetical protein
LADPFLASDLKAPVHPVGPHVPVHRVSQFIKEVDELRLLAVIGKAAIDIAIAKRPGWRHPLTLTPPANLANSVPSVTVPLNASMDARQFKAERPPRRWINRSLPVGATVRSR